MRPHPCEQGTGFLGLCSHCWRWIASTSSLTTTLQPYSSLSQLVRRGEVRTREGQTGTSYRISNLLSKFLSILGTGLSSAIVMVLRSTGQVCCLLSHSTIQSAQKACSHLTQSSLSDSLSTINTHSGARRGSSSTALQIGQINSSSTDPSNLLTS